MKHTHTKFYPCELNQRGELITNAKGVGKLHVCRDIAGHWLLNQKREGADDWTETARSISHSEICKRFIKALSGTD